MERNDVKTLWERRDRLGIIAEIMEVAKEGQLKTQVMYGVSLSFSQLREYLSFLIEMGFLRVREKNGKRVYKTTPKGIKYIESYNEMAYLLKKPDPVETPIFLGRRLGR